MLTRSMHSTCTQQRGSAQGNMTCWASSRKDLCSWPRAKVGVRTACCLALRVGESCPASFVQTETAVGGITQECSRYLQAHRLNMQRSSRRAWSARWMHLTSKPASRMKAAYGGTKAAERQITRPPGATCSQRSQGRGGRCRPAQPLACRVLLPSNAAADRFQTCLPRRACRRALHCVARSSTCQAAQQLRPSCPTCLASAAATSLVALSSSQSRWSIRITCTVCGAGEARRGIRLLRPRGGFLQAH